MTIDQFEIVGMEARDLTILQQVARQAFFETFAHEVSDTDMQQYLESSFALDKLQREYLNADSMFFLARLNKKVIGYIKLNFKAAQTEPQNNSAMEIERIYLLKAYQDRHFGQMLLFKAFSVATQKQCSYIWLGVSERNTKAMHVYRKNGFEVFDEHTFILGSEYQTDLLMKKTPKLTGNFSK